ncbi:MAG: hypothetical protein E7011_03080 [Alphaproteobacteria bacterium]|nr:hypothetical protein [Alphaproteobacteria bacterium]
MSKRHDTRLTPAQQSQQEFMTGLVNVLAHSDLSKMDLSALVNEHNAYSALIDNYEIMITRTPVYAYPTPIRRLLCCGNWVFEPGLYERYEVRIFENPKNMRLHQCVSMFGRANTHFNTVLEYGTMSTNRGYYLCNKYEWQNTTDPENMYNRQNQHLFVPSKQLYNILDSEYNTRASRAVDYKLSDASDFGAMYGRMLQTVRNKYFGENSK